MKIGYKEIERRLESYKKERANLKNLKLMLQNREVDSGLKAIEYGEHISSGRISKPTEQIAIRNISEQERMNKRIVKLENELAMIENSLEALTEDERVVVKGRYFEGQQWWQVAAELKYSEIWCKKIRKSAMDKILGTFEVYE